MGVPVRVPHNIMSRLIDGLRSRFPDSLADLVPDRIALARRFQRTFGRPLNLKNPQTFNEKLFWLMLYYRSPLVTRLADNYEVRTYVAERVGTKRARHEGGIGLMDEPQLLLELA
jgi:hypothetical protein